MDEWNALNPAAHATLHALQPIMMMMKMMMIMTMMFLMIRKRRMKSNMFLSYHYLLGLDECESEGTFFTVYYRTDVGAG